MNNTLNCAIVGFGYMGQIRLKTISEIPKLSVKIVCDSNIENIPFSKKYKITNNFNDIFKEQIDIVFVCTPNNETPNIVIKCLKHKKHVFCEKPPGRNLEDLKKIKKYINSGLKVMFGFNHRFHPAVIAANKIIKSKKLGRIITMRGVYGKSGGVNFKSSWRNNKKISGGGILLDQGIHMIDLFRFFCGDFNQVKCFHSNKFWKFDVEDNAFLIFKNNKNQLANLHSSSTLWRHTFRMDITLEKGYILVEGLLSKTGSYGQEKITYAKRQFENESKAVGNPSETVIYYDQDNSWKLEILSFISYIRKNNDVKINGFKDALKSMELVFKSYKDNK